MDLKEEPGSETGWDKSALVDSWNDALDEYKVILGRTVGNDETHGAYE